MYLKQIWEGSLKMNTMRLNSIKWSSICLCACVPVCVHVTVPVHVWAAVHAAMTLCSFCSKILAEDKRQHAALSQIARCAVGDVHLSQHTPSFLWQDKLLQGIELRLPVREEVALCSGSLSTHVELLSLCVLL